MGIGDLVRNCLRMTPDRIVVGEVRGDEAFFLIRALSSGHGGGFGTIHCNDAHSALRQLQLLAQMAPVGGLSSMVVAEMVGEAIDVVFHQALDEADGKRRVAEVIEVLKPGAVVNSCGGVEYQLRRLVRWDPWVQDWTFPQRASTDLLRSIQLLGLEWPEASLGAPEQGKEVEEEEAMGDTRNGMIVNGYLVNQLLSSVQGEPTLKLAGLNAGSLDVLMDLCKAGPWLEERAQDLGKGRPVLVTMGGQASGKTSLASFASGAGAILDAPPHRCGRSGEPPDQAPG